VPTIQIRNIVAWRLETPKPRREREEATPLVVIAFDSAAERKPPIQNHPPKKRIAKA
jgi:hypothetical protein